MKKALIIANMLFASATVFGMQENSVKWKPTGSVLKAVQEGDLQKVEKAIKNTPWIRCTERNSMVLTFLYNGKNKQPLSKDTLNQLLWEIYETNTAVSMEINFKGDNGETSLHIAVRKKNQITEEMLIDYGADVNIANDWGETPLFTASSEGYENIVKSLVGYGEADVNIANNRGETPLFGACKWNRKDIVKYLVGNKADVNKESINLGNWYDFALNSWQNGSKTPLIIAVDKEFKNIMEHLVEHGADVNKGNSLGNTPLIFAIYKRSISIVEYLVDHGADVNRTNNEGITPLSIAKKKRYGKIAEYLIEHGAVEN